MKTKILELSETIIAHVIGFTFLTVVMILAYNYEAIRNVEREVYINACVETGQNPVICSLNSEFKRK